MKTVDDLTRDLASPEYIRDYRPLPFWSWNDKLDKKRLTEQIEWMHACGIGGFFMHARGGLITEYLGNEWMECCDACCEKAAELDMDAYMYDENGWPSGFVGGKLLDDEQNRDMSLSYAAGEFDPSAFVSYEITPNSLIRADKEEKGKRYLNVFRHVSVSTVDVLNPRVTEQFLDLTHREYKRRYGKKFAEKLKGFFTDEPQYFRWGTSYTPMIATYFREKYGEDILNGLGLLFAEKSGYEEFRYKYWSGMRELFLRNFAEKVYGFCQENGVALTGHYIEETSLGGQMMCCGGVMPFYEYEHIPGIDWLGRGIGSELPVKQVGSVAAQTGKNRILTETFGCCGWDVTPRELKRLLDYQYLGGVNVMCHHLLPSSEYGQRKRDYPQHYTPLNPWINDGFKRFNEYYTRLGALIGHSNETVNACILHPVTSAYIDYKRDCDGFNVGKLDADFIGWAEKLGENHIPHHYVDEVLLKKYGSAENGKLICGKCRYDYLILPPLKNLAATTYSLIRKYLSCGGKILLLGNAPEFIDGKKVDCRDLVSNCTLQEIKDARPYGIDNKFLRSCMRDSDAGKFVFVINPSAEEQTYELSVKGATAVRKLDIDTLTVSAPLPLRRALRAGQSELLFTCNETPLPELKKPVVKLAGTQKVISSTVNTLMLDKARYALGDDAFGEPEALIAIFSRLLEKRYKGKLKLMYEFRCDSVPSDLNVYAEDMNTLSVSINGVPVNGSDTLPHEPKVNIYDASKLVKKGVNEIVVTLDYFQSENVYYALFGEGVTESLRNCMVYDTSLESVYIAGDFGVYPISPRNGQTPRTMLCDGFYIADKKPYVKNFVTDGYATFAGSITFESEINCPDGGCLLEIDGRWQTAEIEINGKHKKLLFDTAADISDMATPGKNTVRVKLTSSLRNLMGPHHFAPTDEPEAVGPEAFDLSGSWKDGQSPLYRPSYSLVKTEF